MSEDNRHTAKIRSAADRTISEPGNTVATSPPARQQVSLITPALNTNRTMTGGRSATGNRH